MIMPMDISTDATTMSMMMKGTKISTPILNAVVISETIKAGTRT